jgi:hypothetical protein
VEGAEFERRVMYIEGLIETVALIEEEDRPRHFSIQRSTTVEVRKISFYIPSSSYWKIHMRVNSISLINRLGSPSQSQDDCLHPFS